MILKFPEQTSNLVTKFPINKTNALSVCRKRIKLHIPAPSNRVCNESKRVSPYSPSQSLAQFIGDSPTSLLLKATSQTVNQVLRFVVNMFFCARSVFATFKHVDI